MNNNFQAEQRPQSDPAFEVEVFSRGAAFTIELAPGALVVGRGADANIRINDGSVSRRHVVLHVGTRVEAEDLNSANGTTLVPASVENSEETTRGDTRQLIPGVRVRFIPGDVLRVGSVIVELRKKNAESPLSGSSDATGLILADPEMLRIYDLLKRAGATEMSILILGETGVGKELMAATVHRHSPRSSHPYLKLNCAALVDSLAESELFGHERGAFTGAVNGKPGLFEAAQGGTVFLDEVAELSPGIQAKLLRVLEERTVIRVGGSRSRAVDVRFVTATNRNLKHQAKAGAFRTDLYYRVSGLVVQIPPLRRRPSEIEPIAHFFLQRADTRAQLPRRTLSEEVLGVLGSHPWPGNVRELRNVVERAALLAGTGPIAREHILIDVPSEPPSRRSASPESVGSLRPVHPTLPTPGHRDVDDRARVIHALELCGGNQTRAAELLGVSRRTLVNRLDAFDLPRPKKRSTTNKTS